MSSSYDKKWRCVILHKRDRAVSGSVLSKFKVLLYTRCKTHKKLHVHTQKANYSYYRSRSQNKLINLQIKLSDVCSTVLTHLI